MALARTRIAPTPSGYLHAGNGVAFLLTAMIAERSGARVRLRIDDLDMERNRPEFVKDIFDSLRWLGVEWAEGPKDPAEQERSFAQAIRIPALLEHLYLLKEQGDLYACTCSRTALRNLPKGKRNCDCRLSERSFSDPEAAWRLHLPADAWVRVPQLFGETLLLNPSALMTDPVLRQRTSQNGGRPSYQIASLVDDVEHGTTIIVRGEDLLPSTACQLYLAERSGMGSFLNVRFVHHPLLLDAEGKKLSKSEGAASLAGMRKLGATAEPLLAEAARMLNVLQEGPG